jgi:DNA-binding transcriptional MocR family regulator
MGASYNIRLQLEAGGVPVYAQIGEQIRRQVASGALRAGDRLPPVRHLATQLGVNVNTVARAYGELAREGLAICRRGGGTTIGGAAGGPVASAGAAGEGGGRAPGERSAGGAGGAGGHDRVRGQP